MDWMSVAIHLADRAVTKLFTELKKDSDITLLSPGLAVGYYYNFLDVMNSQLRFGVFRIKRDTGPAPDDKPDAAFDTDRTTLQIILPSRLDGEAFRRCEAELKEADKGFLYLDAQGRYYGINYRTMNTGGAERVTIVDFARPTMALKRHYEEILKPVDTDPGAKSDRWRKIQRAELLAFEKTLRRLQTRGYGELANRLDITYRG
jgi:hypothetical protein